MENFTIDFLLWAGLFGGVVTPNAMNFVKDFGFRWPAWLKTGVSIVGAGLASFLTIGVAEGWTVEVVNWTDFWQPLLAGLVVTYPIQLTAWRNLWKTSVVGLGLAAIGQPKNPGE
jgi:phosphotransferase system  glucose/maltose/N-acetylglucosamine-specific IIC component